MKSLLDNIFLGDGMFDSPTLDRLVKMTPEEKLELIRKALYSEEHMLKILVKIMLIVDPVAADEIVAWFETRTS